LDGGDGFPSRYSRRNGTVKHEPTAYINRKTGELSTLTTEEMALAEDPDQLLTPLSGKKTSCPKRGRSWQRRTSSRCRVSLRFTSGPSWSASAWSITDAAVSDELVAALHGRGAFRRFKDAVHRLGIANGCNKFRVSGLALRFNWKFATAKIQTEVLVWLL
jgi:hypothetical protein